MKNSKRKDVKDDILDKLNNIEAILMQKSRDYIEYIREKIKQKKIKNEEKQ